MSIPLLQPKDKKPQETAIIKSGGICIVCKASCSEEKKNLQAWKNIEVLAKKWENLKPYEALHSTVDWESGPSGKYIHKLCRLQLSSSAVYENARKRRCEEVTQSVTEEDIPSADLAQPVLRRRRKDNEVIPIHSSELCIFCCQPEDKRHPGRQNSKLFRIEQRSSWNQFKSCTPFVKDAATRDRILAFIRECNDPFARDVRYHKKCWMNNVRQLYDADDLSHCQDLRPQEATALFINHVKECIFENKEPRTLAGLLSDYNNIRHNFNMEKVTNRATVRVILEKEFGASIGFHRRYQANQSIIVYDKSAGGDFIEAAINAWGIDDELLLQNTAKRLREKFSTQVPYSWPPGAESMERFTEPPLLIRKFISWLSDPSTSNCEKSDSSVLMLSDLIWSQLTGKRTSLKVH